MLMMKLALAAFLLSSALVPFYCDAQVVFVNEVSSSGDFSVCGGQAGDTGEDYIELINVGDTPVNLAGYTLFDDKGPEDEDAYTFSTTDEYVLGAGQVALFCGDTNTFQFGIGRRDAIGLRAPNGIVTGTGELPGFGEADASYQRKDDGNYEYAVPTPGEPNAFQEPQVLINEVADKGVEGVCNGEDYVELINLSSNPADISGFILSDNKGPSDIDALVFSQGTVVSPKGLMLLCGDVDFAFGIGGTDTVTLYDAEENVVSSPGMLTGEGSPTLSFQRRPDSGYEYSLPSPNAENLFFSPQAGTVVINEVADKSVADTCNGEDYIELRNTLNQDVDVSGWLLHDDNGPQGSDAFTFPQGSIIASGAIVLYCGDFEGSFQFGIGGDDAITLLDIDGKVVSLTGALQGLGSDVLTYQRTEEGEYIYNFPSPSSPNVPPQGEPILNEVAIFSNDGICPSSWIEIYNVGAFPAALEGYAVSSLSGESYFIPDGEVAVRDFLVVCLPFAVALGDTLTLSDPDGVVVSTTGEIGGTVWALNASNEWAVTLDPTPLASNVFSFVPIPLELQQCGVQTTPFGYLCNYQLNQLLNLAVDGNPELSGGTFDGRTCYHLLNGDEGIVNVVDVDLESSSATSIRKFEVIGGSTDTEGSCLYEDPSSGEIKLAIADERDRSVAICDIPGDGITELYRDSSNCVIIGLSAQQVLDPSVTSADANEGFEGVACDPDAGKLYVIQEKNPMRIWSIDVDSQTIDVLIDVENLAPWTNTVTDMAGVTFDPISRTLYVLSQESEVVVHSTLQGTLIGLPLDVSLADQPEGIHFVPSTGHLFISSEPDEILVFEKEIAPGTDPFCELNDAESGQDCVRTCKDLTGPSGSLAALNRGTCVSFCNACIVKSRASDSTCIAKFTNNFVCAVLGC